jgi:hypothetical protein
VPFAVGAVLLAVALAAGLAVPLEVATSAGGGGAPAALKKGLNYQYISSSS